jgi:hypothetical protein
MRVPAGLGRSLQTRARDPRGAASRSAAKRNSAIVFRHSRRCRASDGLWWSRGGDAGSRAADMAKRWIGTGGARLDPIRHFRPGVRPRISAVSRLGAARLLSPLTTWEQTGPQFLFLGLLTLLNAPFDWASLGLTRALLRRGLELRGWWPYALALADAALAAIIIAAPRSRW